MDTKSIEEKFNKWVEQRTVDTSAIDCVMFGYKADLEDVVRVIEKEKSKQIANLKMATTLGKECIRQTVSALDEILTHLNLNS